jgi:hypothetical protein
VLRQYGFFFQAQTSLPCMIQNVTRKFSLNSPSHGLKILCSCSNLCFRFLYFLQFNIFYDPKCLARGWETRVQFPIGTGFFPSSLRPDRLLDPTHLPIKCKRWTSSYEGKPARVLTSWNRSSPMECNNSIPAAKKTQYDFIRKVILLMMFKKMMLFIQRIVL